MSPISLSPIFITTLGSTMIESIRSTFLEKYPQVNFVIMACIVHIWIATKEQSSFFHATVLKHVIDNKNTAAIKMLVKSKRSFLFDAFQARWSLEVIDELFAARGIATTEYFVAEKVRDDTAKELALQQSNLEKVSSKRKLIEVNYFSVHRDFCEALDQYQLKEDEFLITKLELSQFGYAQEDSDCAAWNRTIMHSFTEKEDAYEKSLENLRLMHEVSQRAEQNYREVCVEFELLQQKCEVAKKRLEKCDKFYFDIKLSMEWLRFKVTPLSSSLFETIKIDYPNIFPFLLAHQSLEDIIAFKQRLFN